ncbi:MAG: bifunctional diaminohydroxyphosphoribosylaminopyrimidine deaminase/5-amino-6-(5-phosphoribosylamino)uracil reductase RibD [Acidobacteria bacterium]|nr:bifunctional diaminohydroxyphosphoribosylaminopyrimidine deaminase/5-amino-6-(5-phosphoribosylamino)uracil reductase RibD [Acidobacteriota bacterium]
MTAPDPNDAHWMEIALELAAQGEALANPNPLVGAVIVRDGQEVARAFHTYEGVKHAEVLALERAGEKARGSTLYLNLEPCSHQGRTPPCVEAIIASGIRRVVGAIADPNPKVNGQGFARLREARVEVATGVGAEEARWLNDAFAGWVRAGRPFVMLKAGMSLDDKIAPAGATRHHWITSEASRAQVQRLRHQVDAVLTGIGTVLADDPLLTDRSGRPRRRPLQRIVLDCGLRLPLDSQLVRSADNDLIVFCGEDIAAGKRRQLAERGADIIELKESGGRLALPAVLKKLGERGLTSVMLEAGARVNASAVEAGVVDKVWLFYAPKVLGPSAVPLLEGGRNLPVLIEYRMHQFDPDFAIEGYVRNVYA